MTPATIYDFYVGPAWLDSCDAAEFSPSRLLAILAKHWADVRMVVRCAETAVAEEDFGDWLESIWREAEEKMKLSELLSQNISIQQSNLGHMWMVHGVTPSWGSQQCETDARMQALSAIIESAKTHAMFAEKWQEWQTQRIIELENALNAAGITLPPGICPRCDERKTNVIKRRLNTMYADEDSNFMVSCESCYQETNELYDHD